MIELLVWTLPVLPLAAFLANGLFGRWLKEIGGWLAVFALGIAAALALILFVAAWTGRAGLDEPVAVPLWEWVRVGSLRVSLGFQFDRLTAVMTLVITLVGSLIFLYSIGYMRGDPGFSRFFAFLSLFVFSMLILVLADSLPLLFVGWEAVGLCSYLLIGYYLDLPGSASAGKKAFVVNRVGDFGFLVAMFLLHERLGTLAIPEILDRAPGRLGEDATSATLIALALMLGCAGKSAQIPLFVWLPDAMAGPTPVSALIHAATMVTAGVYLLARLAPLLALAPGAMLVIALLGAATAFVAATIALTQRDIKKVLAYSTISQLGYMFLACGVGAFAAGVFHVLTHAFFKACLFLAAGAVIHAAGGLQDLFLLGGLRRRLRLTWVAFGLATLALAGLPPAAGFFSKDEILWRSFAESPAALRPLGVPILYLLGAATAVMTAAYGFRALFLAFHGATRLPPPRREHLHAPHWTMSVAMTALAVGSLTAGLLNVPRALAHRLGLGEGAQFEHFLRPVLEEAERLRAETVGPAPVFGETAELALTALSVLLALLGLFLAYRYALRGWPDAADRLATRWSLFSQISRAGWWWDDAYNALIGAGTRQIARLAVWIDAALIDGTLHLISRLTREASRAVRHVQMGQVQAYALLTLIGVNLLLLAVWLW